ncbi:hypothetical protein [Pseudonocardia lacus]|uniref:hypothetical protein n=1 Tax=Pseudonocardia lacus TaxID=2835865 RepID=UPI001BDD869D|nr:hypothetical protein [Pseudonocardia lacus]
MAVGAGDRVVGWKAGCGCGWRSSRTYDRDRFPSVSGVAPAEVEGSATGTGAFSEWRFHLFAAVPELVVADTVNVVLRSAPNRLTNPLLAAVVAVAREHGATWPLLADAAGVTLREAKWAWAPPRVDPVQAVRRRRAGHRRAAHGAAPAHRRRDGPAAGSGPAIAPAR